MPMTPASSSRAFEAGGVEFTRGGHSGVSLRASGSLSARRGAGA